MGIREIIDIIRDRLMARPIMRPLIILLVAICFNAAFLIVMGPYQELDADGPAWLSVSQNLASGRGFYNDYSPWKNIPTSNLNPGWPLIVVPFLKLFAALDPKLAIRLTAAILNVLVAVMLARLTFRLSFDPVAALFAGLFYAVYPAALHLMYNGMGETSFVLFLILALHALVDEHWFLGAALLGYACIIRHNTLAFPPYFLLVAALHPRCRAIVLRRVGLPRLAACVALILVPISLWILRNYGVTGHFPVINTQDGITLQGANNDIVANSVQYWGHWIWTDEIPGELKHVEIAARMTPYEANLYRKGRALAYFKTHWPAYPRLLLGRLVRAYVPVPWNPDLPLAIACAGRLALYVLCIASRRYWQQRIPGIYLVSLTALLFMSLTTTLLVFAQARYVFWLEVALMPLAVIGLVQMMARAKVDRIPGRQAVTA